MGSWNNRLPTLAVLYLASSASCMDYEPRGPVVPVYPPTDPPELPAQVQTDVWSAAPQKAVDILVVVDNSCSMIDDQSHLASNAGPLFRPIVDAGLDYRIGVTTTDCSTVDLCGRIVATVDSSSPGDPILNAQNAIAQGVAGWGDETGVLALGTTFARPDNQTYFRWDAPLHVIIISDEPDHSTQEEIDLTYRELNDQADQRDVVSVTAIVRLDQAWSLTCTADYGPAYLDLATAYHGEKIDICSEDWSTALAAVGERFLEMDYTFPLSRNPVDPVDSTVLDLSILYGGVVIKPIEEDWDYDLSSNSIALWGYEPRYLDEVTATYWVEQ